MATAQSQSALNTITLSVNRKESTGNYGSHGAGAELTLLLPKELGGDELVAFARIHQDVLETIVEGHLAKKRTDDGDGSNGQPFGSSGHPKKLPGQQVDHDNQDEATKDREKQSHPSVNAVALLKWADREGLKTRLFDLARTLELPRRFKEWESEDTARVYQILCKSCRKPDSKIPF
jgi:hypothetical protein